VTRYPLSGLPDPLVSLRQLAPRPRTVRTAAAVHPISSGTGPCTDPQSRAWRTCCSSSFNGAGRSISLPTHTALQRLAVERLTSGQGWHVFNWMLPQWCRPSHPLRDKFDRAWRYVRVTTRVTNGPVTGTPHAAGQTSLTRDPEPLCRMQSGGGGRRRCKIPLSP